MCAVKQVPHLLQRVPVTSSAASPGSSATPRGLHHQRLLQGGLGGCILPEHPRQAGCCLLCQKAAETAGPEGLTSPPSPVLGEGICQGCITGLSFSEIHKMLVLIPNLTEVERTPLSAGAEPRG